ncbi:MAG: hypothetical protein QM706_21335, partial [Nitrospira sp.]
MDIFRANVIDSTPSTYSIEVSGDPKKDRSHHQPAS